MAQQFSFDGTTLSRIREVWRHRHEDRFVRSVTVPLSNDGTVATQAQAERYRDLIDWLDTVEGRAFLSEALPETRGVVFPGPSRISDQRYVLHCNMIAGAMNEERQTFEDNIVVPRRGPVVFAAVGFFFGVLCMFLLTVI